MHIGNLVSSKMHWSIHGFKNANRWILPAVTQHLNLFWGKDSNRKSAKNYMEGVEDNFYYVLTVVAFLLLTGQNLETRNYMEGNFTMWLYLLMSHMVELVCF